MKPETEQRLFLSLAAINFLQTNLPFEKRTAGTVAMFSGVPLSQSGPALRMAHNHNLASRGGSPAQWSLTDDGYSALMGAITRPYLQVAFRQWRDEVLMGIQNNGKQTTKENAVLSTKRR